MKATILKQQMERDELLKRPYIDRHMPYSKEEVLKSPLIKLISGPRRVGKSTFALLLLKESRFAYLNFDDSTLLDKWDEEWVMRTLDEVYNGYDYLMLDEVQNLPNWDIWVSKLFRRGKNLVITGSNAKMLSSEMATLLTGRYLQIEMLPFSLQEMMTWRKIDMQHLAESQQTEANLLVDDYLHNGGYPETIEARNLAKSYLSTLFDSIIWKDVAKRHRIRNVSDLNNLATYLLSNFCNMFSINELASDLGISSVSTAKKYMGYLHEPYLFFFLPRYNNKLKLMKKAAQKTYVVDNGFVQSKGFNLSENLGRLLENQVFMELLRKGYDTEKTLFYYRSRNDKETDFVTRKGTQIEQLIQVCYSLSSPKAEKRETESIVECAEELNCEKLIIVTYEEERTISLKGHVIQVMPVLKFCIEKSA